MKTEAERLYNKQLIIEAAINGAEKQLSRLKINLARINHKLGLIRDARDTASCEYISVKMLELLTINTPYSSHQLREAARAWRSFLALPRHIQDTELERHNISVEKIGTNGRQFTRREF